MTKKTRDMTQSQFYAALDRNAFFRPRGNRCKSKHDLQKFYTVALNKDGTMNRRATVAKLIKDRANPTGRIKWFLQFFRPIPIVTPIADQPTVSELERKRRKFDKFVKPKGEKAPKIERVKTQEIKPKIKKASKIETQQFPTDHFLIKDTHHEARENGDVLYKGAEMYGEFNFRDTILQQLDRYFFYLKRMKKMDPDAFGFYRKVGATIVPYVANGSQNREMNEDEFDNDDNITIIPEWFKKTRPAFGCFAYGADPETERFEKENSRNKTLWVPKFFYYLKVEKPIHSIQPPMMEGDIYLFTIWWDKADKENKYGVPQQVPIFISKDGETICPLKVLQTEIKTIYSKRHHRTFQIPVRKWTIDKEFETMAKNKNQNVSDFLTSFFIYVINTIENSQISSMIKVSVTKNRMRATFSVNATRTAYFFQDRDIEITEKGARKAIFHTVRAHIRNDGSTVKMHFRGARKFKWAGYDVEINVPGYHHRDVVSDFDLGFVDEEHVTDEKMVTFPEVGNRLSKLMYGN